jgi:hypothetical protein
MPSSTPIRLAGALIACAAAAACAQPQPGETGPQPATPERDVIAAVSRPRSSSDVITGEEIRASMASNAFQVIQKLRPGWLVLRGDPDHPDPDGSSVIRVYYNGSPVGDVSVLRQYEVSQLISIRWIDGINARATYGGGHGRGVISITGR